MEDMIAGPRIRKRDVKRIGAELVRIEKRDGVLTAASVFEAGKSRSSALHRYFIWDKNAAWIEANLARARAIIRNVRVEYRVPESKEPVTVRSFQFVPSRDGYQSTRAALDNPLTRAEVLRIALAELRSFREKYATLRELSAVHQAIDSTLAAKLEARRKRA